jgi:hypothetical protein
MRMKGAVVLVERSEQVKWWDALDELGKSWNVANVEKGLQLARECRHADAQWLASLFPPGEAVAPDRMIAVLLAQGDDPRALFIASQVGSLYDNVRLKRAAEMGYAPAQAVLSTSMPDDDQAFLLAERAVAQGDRSALNSLAWMTSRGRGCTKNVAKGIELFRQAAELGHATASYMYATRAFGEEDFERFLWCGRAALLGAHVPEFCRAVLGLIPSFETGEHGRILHLVAPVLRVVVDRRQSSSLKVEDELGAAPRVAELHAAMLTRAREAIASWSLVSRRLGIVKDVRVMIAKMVWEEPWRWSVVANKSQP